MPKTYGIMIVGTGWVSGEHIRAFQMNRHAKVVAIVSRSAERGRAKADEYGLGLGCKIYTDYDEGLKDPNVDVVVICTPNDMHCEQTIKAAEAGKHILLEKPVALSWEDTKRMAEAVKKAGVKTLVGYVLHYNPLFMAAKKLQKDFYQKSGNKKTLIAFGASPYSVKERRLISRKELDAVCPDKEIMVVKYDGHACIVNSLLLKKMEDKVKKLRGYHPDTGEMNQEAFFKFSDYITNSLSLLDLFSNMMEAVDFQASRGIGMIHTVSGVGFTGNLDITFEKIFAKSLNNGFQVRVFPQSLNIRVATGRKLPRIGGCFECALDGCFGSHDASMNEPYVDEIGGDGVLYYSDEKVIEFCKTANRAGLQIEMHAIGDKAFDQATRALKAALDDLPRKDHRHGIIHDCLPTEAGIRICRDYGILMPVQSAFINWKQEPDEYLVSVMGEERANRLNPLKSFVDNGIIVSCGSDAPCTSPSPIVWMDKAVNNKTQSVSIQEALRMCTYNGYYTTFDEKERGSLEAGKIADMAILSDNPYEISPTDIGALKVEQLILAGKGYESCKRGIGKAIIDGMLNGSKAY